MVIDVLNGKYANMGVIESEIGAEFQREKVGGEERESACFSLVGQVLHVCMVVGVLEGECGGLGVFPSEIGAYFQREKVGGEERESDCLGLDCQGFACVTFLLEDKQFV